MGTDGDTRKAAFAIVESSLSLTPPVESSQGMLSLSDSSNFGATLFSSHQEASSSTWILDFVATDHMTFDANDFSILLHHDALALQMPMELFLWSPGLAL